MIKVSRGCPSGRRQRLHQGREIDGLTTRGGRDNAGSAALVVRATTTSANVRDLVGILEPSLAPTRISIPATASIVTR